MNPATATSVKSIDCSADVDKQSSSISKKNVSFLLANDEEQQSSNTNNDSPNILKSTTVIEIEHYTNYDEETRKSLWHSRSDYHFSRSTARVIAKESERYGHSKQLDGVFISAYDDKVQSSLNIWCIHGHSRRGLERWANSHHGRIRKDDQYMYLQSILRSQHEMKSSMPDKSIAVKAERLREVSFILSRKSRLFAQMMGEADYQASRATVSSQIEHNNSNNTSTRTASATTHHNHRSIPSTTRPMMMSGPARTHNNHPSHNNMMMTMRIPPPGQLPSSRRGRNLGLVSPSSGNTASTNASRKVNCIADLPSSSTSTTPSSSLTMPTPSSATVVHVVDRATATATASSPSITSTPSPATPTTPTSPSSSRNYNNDGVAVAVATTNRNDISAATITPTSSIPTATTIRSTTRPIIIQGVVVGGGGITRSRNISRSISGNRGKTSTSTSTPGRVPRMA